jgi:hypothetical protein
VFGLKPVTLPETDCVVVPASLVAKLAVRKTVDDAVQGAETFAQLSIVAWLVPMKSFGVDAKNLALMVPATDEVVDVMLVIAPVVASGIAVITAMPSARLPPTAAVCPIWAFAAPRMFVVTLQGPDIEAQDEPPPPPEPLPPPPP